MIARSPTMLVRGFIGDHASVSDGTLCTTANTRAGEQTRDSNLSFSINSSLRVSLGAKDENRILLSE